MLVRRIARPLLSAAFIGQGVDTLRNPKPAAEAAKPSIEGLQKLPEPVGSNVPSDAITFARINAGVQIGGGVLLATGKLPRLASAALAFTVVPGNLGAHMFWAEVDPERKAEARRGFLTDLSLLGGLIIASADTAGKPSLGWRGRRAARKLGDKVTSALPAGSTAAGSLTDSVLAEKIGHGLQIGAERGRELAHVAGERGAELAEVAKDRGADLAEVAKDRGADWADVAKDRGADLAEVAKDRGAVLSKRARKRAAKLADVAKDRGSDWADVAKDRGADLAEVTRDRAAELADALAEATKERRAELADVARARGAELADTTKSRSADFADVARDRSAVLAEAARDRTADLADLTKARAAELAANTRYESLQLADAANAKAKSWRW